MVKTKSGTTPRTIRVRTRTVDVLFVYSKAPGGLTPDEATRLGLALIAISDEAD